MINKIKIANVASYDTTGIEISDLKKINFFYGANGCGKTTISNFLANTNDARFHSCLANWMGNQPIKVLVYNRQFRHDNFSTGNIAGVFTLGQATTEELENIQTKKNRVSELRKEHATQLITVTAQKDKLTKHIEEFTNECWTVYKRYEKDFKEALRGSINAKPTFKDKILSEKMSNSAALLSLFELKDKASTLLGSQPTRIDTIQTIGSYESIGDIEKDAIWKKVIVGKTDVNIAGLIGKLGNSDWVSQGRKYLRDDQTCPFCQQATINANLKSQIEEYFDESFEREKKRIDSQRVSYLSLCNAILASLDQIEASEKAKSDTKLDIETFSAHLKALHSQISENKLLIGEKQEKASQIVELTDTSAELVALSRLIEKANSVIAEHNLLVVNYKQEVDNLKRSVWRYLVEELSDKIKNYESTENGLQRGINAISSQVETRKQDIQNLDNEIVELSKNVTSVQPAVDEINRTLKSYGFTNFQIVASPDLDNYYAIQRENGELAHETLSEGEVTFITFLYFVQLAKGALDQDSVTHDRVLVIDDPISSLDNNILYVVSIIVKDFIRGIKENTAGSIKQLLLLTHNVYFHKEASFQGSRSNGDRDISFWILRKNQNITSIQAYGQDNPIESSYELLWREVKEWRRNSGITLQNTMRRIIENYFKILGKFTDDGLVERFNTFEEQQICRSLISWINDGSHTISDGLYVQTPDDSAEKYLNVFEKVFEHTNNHGHYLMMMGQESPRSSD
jgi:wobble nucleotide-excising tRNase